MYVTRPELNAALRDMMDQIREMFAGRAAISAPLGSLDNISTADSGAELLVDRVRLWGSTDSSDPDAATTLGRLEYAGHLTIPRLREPAQVIGDASNGQYFPLASATYRPSGGKVGDSCQYNLTDTTAQRATMWTRETGKVEIDSGFSAPASQDVVVNHGTLKVARVSDIVVSGQLQVEMKIDPMTMSLNVKMTYRSDDPNSAYHFIPKTLMDFNVPGGTPNVPPDGFQEDVIIGGTITTGADHFKA